MEVKKKKHLRPFKRLELKPYYWWRSTEYSGWYGNIVCNYPTLLHERGRYFKWLSREAGRTI
jgi:hypothetical protein